MRQRFKELLVIEKKLSEQVLAIHKDELSGESRRNLDFFSNLIEKRFPKSFRRMNYENAPKVLKRCDRAIYDVVEEGLKLGLRHRYWGLLDDEKQCREARRRLVERGLRPRPGATKAKLDEVWESTYSTQGFGARKYAESAAKLKELNAKALGLNTAITTTSTKFDHGVSWSGVRETVQFQVWVFVEEEVDAEIAKLCPAMPLRDWVKACWKSGVNPRVYNPFLPHGYEDSVGLDYFGGEFRKEKSAGS